MCVCLCVCVPLYSYLCENQFLVIRVLLHGSEDTFLDSEDILAGSHPDRPLKDFLRVQTWFEG